MGVNKVDLKTGETLIDLTGDTVTPQTLATGVTAHDASGAIITGTATPVQLVQTTGNSETAVMSQKAITDMKNSGELNGERGTGILKVTTAPSGYTTAIGSYTPKYRIALSTVTSQSKVSKVMVGDVIQYSYYQYHVDYLDSSYAYISATRTSLRGAAGTTPVRGTDYWTEADQEAIVQQVITALGTPVFGRMMDDANIVLSGDLADGTYTLWFEGKDGKLKELCTMEHDADAPNYTNQIPISTDKDGSIYNGTGYKANTRGNSSGAPADISNTSAPNAVFFTGFIPAATGSVIRLKNCFIFATGGTEKATENYGDAPFGLRSGLYNASKAKVAVESWGNLKNNATNVFSNYTIVEADNDGDGKIYQFTIAASGISFVRLCLAPTGSPADAIVTVNEEIID